MKRLFTVPNDVTELVKELEGRLLRPIMELMMIFKRLLSLKKISKLKGEKRTFISFFKRRAELLNYGKEEILRRLRAKMVV